jgi:long-chain fatty acid transport protein
LGGSDFESCLGGKKGPGFGWEDMTVYKLGASWKYSDTWTWRAGYSFTDQPIPKDQMTFNILAPGVVEQHFTVGFTQARPGGNEVNLSFMYAPETSVKGENNFDPRQTVELSMSQIELELSYSWKR